MRQSAFNKTAGFSLLEILVAVMILSFISATIWVSMSASLNVQERTRSLDERNHEVAMALDRMARDISTAYLSKNQSIDKKTRTLFWGKQQGDTDRIDFTALSHLKIIYNANESDECEISYFTQTIDGNLALMRRESSVIDDNPEEGGNTAILLEDVISFNLRFFDLRNNTWVDDWNSDSAFQLDKLPNQVEVTLAYKNPRGETEVRSIKVNITMTEALTL